MNSKTLMSTCAAVVALSFAASAATLKHRWSFNGDLSDSVGGSTAITIRSSKATGVVFNEAEPVFENNAVKLGSDNYASGNATSHNLGENLATGNNVTIEIWGTRLRQTTNMRLFDWGNGGIDNTSPSQYLCFPWNDAPTIWTYGKNSPGTIANCFADNVKYHVVLTVTQEGTSSKYHLVRRNAADVSDVKYVDYTVPNWTLSNVASGRLYLGHSQWVGYKGNGDERDIDANATYDEVRIWDGVLSDAQIAKNAADGPDKIEMLPLAHRWSFNGDLNDSVGTSHATALGDNVSLSDGAATLNGTTHGTGSINLGANLVSGGDVTIEIWGRCNEIVQNGRLIDWGPGTRYLAIPWNSVTSNKTIIWMYGGGANSGEVDDFFTPGGETGIDFHIAFTIRKDGTSSVMRLVRRKTSDLSDIKELNHTVPNWALTNISGSNLYLGRSQWDEPDAHATYDEVRVWRGVLSDDALALSAATGPDATAEQIAAIVAKSAVSRTLNLASGGTIDLGGNTFVQPSLVLGGGTVANGTLVVNGTTDLHVGDSIVNTGTIDLSGATFNLVDPENLTGKYSRGFTFIRGGTIVGKPTVANLPKGWNVVVSGDKARIGKLGIVVIVR